MIIITAVPYNGLMKLQLRWLQHRQFLLRRRSAAAPPTGHLVYALRFFPLTFFFFKFRGHRLNLLQLHTFHIKYVFRVLARTPTFYFCLFMGCYIEDVKGSNKEKQQEPSLFLSFVFVSSLSL